MSAVEHPPLEPVSTIIALFQERGWPVALGGSAVLASLGLTDLVRDWDVTVEAEPGEVAGVLANLNLVVEDRTGREHPFATRALLTVVTADHEIDVLVGFALRDPHDSEGASVSIPVRVARHWLGLPIAHPADWKRAYELMGRTDRAAALGTHLAESD